MRALYSLEFDDKLNKKITGLSNSICIDMQTLTFYS